MRIIRFGALALLCLAIPAFAQRTLTHGVFTDRDGKPHVWQITPTHALQWDNQSYIPAGGTFAPRYFADGQTDENWAKDVQALDTVKAKGGKDILIDPVVSAIDVPA